MNRAISIFVLLVVALGVSGCSAPKLLHFGYTSTNKVWYHSQLSGDDHRLIVCDVQPNGSETNCRESEQVDNRDSRIKKCDIAPDNSARCSVQFDLR